MRRLFLLLLIFPAIPLAAFSPVLNQINPRGGQRGTELEMHFHGDQLDGIQEALCYQPGISFRDWKVIDAKHLSAVASIAADAPLGEHPMRLRTSSGITEMRLFLVGQFPCVDEVEPNSQFDQGQTIEINRTIHGVVKAEDEDYFVCHLKQGQRLSAEVEAIRLGKEMFDAYVAILDPQRFELSASDDSPLLRTDCYASIVAPADGDYRIVVREAGYEGNDNCHYRLHISQAPRPAAVHPLGGKPGETVEFTFFGDAAGPITQSITLPAQGPNPFPLFVQDQGLSAPSPNWIALSPLEASKEVEPNPNSKRATPLPPLPCAAHGVISEKNDVDWFHLRAVKGDALLIKVHALSLRSSLDSVLSLRDHQGKNLATNDDQGSLDSQISWNCPADGDYYLRLQDKLRRGRHDFTYRIEIQRKTPSISATLPTVERVQTQKWKMLTVPRGNRYAAVVNVTRENVACELQLFADSLPAGMTLHAPVIPKGSASFPILLEATPDAPIAGGLFPIGLKAVGEGAPADLRGALLERIEHVDINNQGSYHGTSVDRISMAVIDEAPLRIELEPPTTPIVKNGILPLAIKAQRREGYHDAVNLRFLWSPPGIGAPATVTLPANAQEVVYEINASNDAAVGTWPIVILAEAPTPQGTVLVSSQIAQLTIAEPYLTLNLELAATEQKQSLVMLGKIEVTTPFEGQATAQLLGLPHGATGKPVTFSADAKELLFPIEVAADAAIGKHQSLFCEVLVPYQGRQIRHRVAQGGTLRIDAPRPAPSNAPTAAPAPNVTAPTTPQAPPTKPLSRLEQLRQNKAGK